MKRILVTGMVVLLGFTVCAQNEKSELPPQLVQLKKGYEAKVKVAIDPIKREYKAALDKLLKQYGASGNIKFAVEVQKELDLLNDENSNLKDFLVGTTWTWHRVRNEDRQLKDVFIFETKDIITCPVGSWSGSKWKIISPNKVQIINSNKKGKAEITFSEDRKMFSGTDFDGKNLIQGELVETKRN